MPPTSHLLREPKTTIDQRYYHIEGTEKKDPAAPVGGSDLDRQGFDAKRRLARFPKLLPGKLSNMSPENQWLEDVFPIEIYSPFFRGHVSFQGCR